MASMNATITLQGSLSHTVKLPGLPETVFRKGTPFPTNEKALIEYAQARPQWFAVGLAKPAPKPARAAEPAADTAEPDPEPEDDDPEGDDPEGEGSDEPETPAPSWPRKPRSRKPVTG